MRNRDKATVIYYHSIGPANRNWRKSFLTVGADLFERHLVWLKGRYNTISLGEYRQIREGLSDPVRNPLIITFDDGYMDNWIWAFPILKRHGMKATIFVSPEFTDAFEGCRPNLEDYEAGRASLDEITRWGFLSWDEMRMMEKSGLIDIQSHSLTHTKYPVSDRLTGFHHPGGDILYPASNAFLGRKPYYIDDPGFGTLLPYGYPLFEDRASLMARKVEINPDFIADCIRLFDKYDFGSYSYTSAFNIAEPLYNEYRSAGKLITSTESEEEYIARVKDEMRLSKEIIEEMLGKKVEYLCWPHGSNNDLLHWLAIEAGYLMTTTGKAEGVSRSDKTRIPDRAIVDLSSWRKKGRTVFRMRAFAGEAPYRQVLAVSRRIRFGSKK